MKYLDLSDAAVVVAFAIAIAIIVAAATYGGDTRGQSTAVAACGECSEVRECGSLVCVPGKGWQESTR